MRIFVCSGMLILGLATGSAAQTPPFQLQWLDVPPNGELKVPAGGWSLDLAITIPDKRLVAIGGFYGNWDRPERDWRVLLVTQDPDGCPSWIARNERKLRSKGGLLKVPCGLPADQPWPEDETWIEARPGTISLHPESSVGTRCAGQPKVRVYEVLVGDTVPGANTRLEGIGPCVAEHAGYGRNPRLPSLVVLADQGPGKMMNAAFQELKPIVARNLAGFFTDIGFRWRDSAGHRRIQAHMLVPRGLFSSSVAVDGNIDHVPWTFFPGPACAELQSVDGAEPFCALPGSLYSKPTSVRAFLVAGSAPDRLMDLNGDRRVTADDAVAAGHRLMSNEVVLSVLEHRGARHISVDLDTNGSIAPISGIPLSPLDLTGPPP